MAPSISRSSRSRADERGSVTGRTSDSAQDILARIRSIPKGFVATYGDIEPHAPRLVGRVLATTDRRVPWHRVVRSDGTVAKGRRQLDLLRQEGVPILRDRVDLRKARFHALRSAPSKAPPGGRPSKRASQRLP